MRKRLLQTRSFPRRSQERVFPAPLPVPTNPSPVLKDAMLTALPCSLEPGLWPPSVLCLCVSVCLLTVVLWLLICGSHCSRELCVCSLSWEGLGHAAIHALCPPVASIPSCSLESALALRSPSPISGFRFEETWYPGQESPAALGLRSVYHLCCPSSWTQRKLAPDSTSFEGLSAVGDAEDCLPEGLLGSFLF